jgi:hypothetical protein
LWKHLAFPDHILIGITFVPERMRSKDRKKKIISKLNFEYNPGNQWNNKSKLPSIDYKSSPNTLNVHHFGHQAKISGWINSMRNTFFQVVLKEKRNENFIKSLI